MSDALFPAGIGARGLPGWSIALTPIAIAVLSVSMSADAFAAAIGRGASERPSLSSALRAGLVFGVIEALTPIMGWALGLAASSFVAQIDHWIAFVLLGVVGGKMVWGAATRRADDIEAAPPAKGAWTLVATAIGTSIDAAAVGVSLALLGAPIIAIALSIGLTTFALASLGMDIGRAAGVRLGSVVEVLGGLALMALGTRILLEHLGYIA